MPGSLEATTSVCQDSQGLVIINAWSLEVLGFHHVFSFHRYLGPAIGTIFLSDCESEKMFFYRGQIICNLVYEASFFWIKGFIIIQKEIHQFFSMVAKAEGWFVVLAFFPSSMKLVDTKWFLSHHQEFS